MLWQLVYKNVRDKVYFEKKIPLKQIIIKQRTNVPYQWPVKCDICGTFEYVKLSEGNYLGSLACLRCRTGQYENSIINVLNFQIGFYLSIRDL